MDLNNIEFLIDSENITDSNIILNNEILFETVHNTELSSNINQPQIIVVVPQIEVNNTTTANTEQLFFDPEYSENIDIVIGGRKKKKINKRKNDQYDNTIEILLNLI